MLNFNSAIASAIRDVHEVRIAELGERLLHYTSQPALRAIIETESMRLGSLAHMNDPDEIDFGLRFLEGVLESVNELCESDSSDVARQKSRLVQSMIDELGELGDQYASVFTLSLTGVGERLIHWRTYGDDGRGVAIEFSKGCLMDLPAQGMDTCFLLVPMIYHDKDHRIVGKAIHEVIDKAFQNSQYVKSVQEMDEGLILAAARQSLTSMSLIPLVVKSSNYREEHEWRLVATVSRGSVASIGSHKVGTKDVPHLTVPLSVLCGQADPPVSRLLLGPAVDRKVFAGQMMPLLAVRGRKKPNYSTTKIRYRPRAIAGDCP